MNYMGLILLMQDSIKDGLGGDSMRSFISGLKDCNNGSGISLEKLAVIAAFFTLFGDFLAFIAAVLALQQSSGDTKKMAIQKQINSMHSELDRISKSL